MTDVQLLYGTGEELSENPVLTTLTFEHANVWEYGDNYIFVDVFRPFESGTTFYGEWHPRFSLSRISKRTVGAGFINDVLLYSEINFAEGWRAYLIGVGLDIDLPHFSFCWVDIGLRNDPSIPDASAFQVTPSWGLPFSIGKLNFEFGGVINFIGAEGPSAFNILAQPQLLVDAGSWLGSKNKLMIGIEYHYWKNKYGIDGVDESIPQAMVKWVF